MSDQAEERPTADGIIVISDDPAEAAALSVALTSDGLAATPGTLASANNVGTVILLGRHAIDPSEVAAMSGEATVISAGPSDVEAMLIALEYGALAYVEGDAPYEHFTAAIKAAHRGEATVPSHMLGALLRRVIEQQREQRQVAAQLDVLSRRERQVFQLVAQGADKHALAEQLFISPETARTHIQNVMTKLGVTSRVELVGLASAAGFPVVPTEGVNE